MNKHVEIILHAGAGWFTPTGIAVTCGLYDHFFALNGSSHVDDDIRYEIDALQDRLSDWRQEVDESDDHPAWHNYDFYKDDEEDKIYYLMMSKGWIRVGSYAYDGSTCDMGVEGSAEALEKHARTLGAMRCELRKTGNKLDAREIKIKKRRR